MDIDIQTILQQDIDLGITKSLNYEYESTATATPSSVGYELFNKYLGGGGGGGGGNSGSENSQTMASKRGGEFGQADFYMRPAQLESETQKVGV